MHSCVNAAVRSCSSKTRRPAGAYLAFISRAAYWSLTAVGAYHLHISCRACAKVEQGNIQRNNEASSIRGMRLTECIAIAPVSRDHK
eukprot:18261-Heterococcus_DN1.PRE.2